MRALSPLLAAAGLALAACNSGGAAGDEAAARATIEERRARPGPEDIVWLRSLEIGDNTVVVSESTCGCGDFQEKYRFEVTPASGEPFKLVLYHPTFLGHRAREQGYILPGQELWYLERTDGSSATPLAYLNFQPTYEEAEGLVRDHLTGREEMRGLFQGGWMRENDSDPRPPNFPWSMEVTTAILMRGYF